MKMFRSESGRAFVATKTASTSSGIQNISGADGGVSESETTTLRQQSMKNHSSNSTSFLIDDILFQRPKVNTNHTLILPVFWGELFIFYRVHAQVFMLGESECILFSIP